MITDKKSESNLLGYRLFSYFDISAKYKKNFASGAYEMLKPEFNINDQISPSTHDGYMWKIEHLKKYEDFGLQQIANKTDEYLYFLNKLQLNSYLFYKESLNSEASDSLTLSQFIVYVLTLNIEKYLNTGTIKSLHVKTFPEFIKFIVYKNKNIDFIGLFKAYENLKNQGVFSSKKELVINSGPGSDSLTNAFEQFFEFNEQFEIEGKSANLFSVMAVALQYYKIDYYLFFNILQKLKSRHLINIYGGVITPVRPSNISRIIKEFENWEKEFLSFEEKPDTPCSKTKSLFSLTKEISFEFICYNCGGKCKKVTKIKFVCQDCKTHQHTHPYFWRKDIISSILFQEKEIHLINFTTEEESKFTLFKNEKGDVECKKS